MQFKWNISECVFAIMIFLWCISSLLAAQLLTTSFSHMIGSECREGVTGQGSLTCRSQTPAVWAVGRSRWGEGSWGRTDPSVLLYTGATRWAAASSRTWCCGSARSPAPASSSGWSSWSTPPTSSWLYLCTGERRRS